MKVMKEYNLDIVVLMYVYNAYSTDISNVAHKIRSAHSCLDISRLDCCITATPGVE